MGPSSLWGSLQRRLTLAVSVLLLAILAAFSALAYRTVERALNRVAEARLDSAAGQLAGLLGEIVAIEQAFLNTLLGRPEIVAFLEQPSPTTEAAARAALAQAVSAGPSRQEITLRTGTGVVLSSADVPVLDDSGVPGTITPLSMEDGRVSYELSVGGPGTLGDVVISERLQLAERGSALGQRLRELIGQGASFLLANATWDVWTGSDGPGAGSPPPAGADGLSEHEVAGVDVLGLERPIPGTPWVVWLGLPSSVVVAPLTAFIARLGAVAFVLVLIGSGCAWAIGRRLASPLVQLTHAAESIASGDYSRRIQTRRSDEIGRLARAFEVMGREVREREERLALDLAKRKETEEALRTSERRLRNLFETVNLIVLVVDTEGNVDYVNPFLVKLTGYDEKDLIGKDVFERLRPDWKHEDVAGPFRELLERPDSRFSHFQAPIATKDGREVKVSWHNTVLRDSAQRPVGIVSVGEDITERAQLEEQLQRAQKMESIGRLAGGIAHDFNNLLTAILGPAELLLMDKQEGDPEKDDLMEIKGAAERAAGLTRQLLAFSRQQVMEPRVLALNAVIGDLDRLLKRVIGEDITLRTVPGSELGTVRADPGQLEQVILNLVINSRDAMPSGGTLTIETMNAELDDAYAAGHIPVIPGRYVMLAISDTGIGMDEKTRAQIFEPFFTTKPKGKGTGLGLATVYGIVKQSGGYIWAYSEPDQGTTIKIYLPRIDEPVPTTVAATRSENLTGPETILVVEDEKMVQTATRKMLEARGYHVMVAERGREALELARDYAGPIALLVTDVVMPEMGGRELSERLTEIRPETKVLFVSGYTDDMIVQHGVLEEGVHFLQKPFTFDALARKVRTILDMQPLATS